MKIVFLMRFMFPYGTAYAMRARSICKLLEKAGHDVHVIAENECICSEKNRTEFSYETLYGNEITILQKIFSRYQSIKALKNYCKKNKVDCIISSALFDRFKMVATVSKKNNIRYIVENCEWYDSSNFKLGRLDPRFYQNEKMIKKDFRKADGFISISRLLHEHNEGLGKKSVRIPTILDVENTPYSETTNNKKITIVYTGTPGKSKEYLLPPIKALAENEKLRERIEFHIYGPTYETVLNNIGNNEELLKRAGESVVIHGRIPQNEVQDVLTKADYLLFLRPDRHSSHAGFPTKLGESFAVGTPVIANNTGDLSLYIKTAENGFLLDSFETNAVHAAFTQIADLNSEEYKNIRIRARKTAEKCFDYRKYADEINDLLGEQK